MRRSMADLDFFKSLNESPSEKEGKCRRFFNQRRRVSLTSMKVPPKRKGNGCAENQSATQNRAPQ